MTHTLPKHFNTTNIIYLFSLFVHKAHYLFVVANRDIQHYLFVVANEDIQHYLFVVANGYVPHYLFVVANGVFAFVTMSRTS